MPEGIDFFHLISFLDYIIVAENETLIIIIYLWLPKEINS